MLKGARMTATLKPVAAISPQKAASPMSYIEVFRATPVDRIRMIKDGVSAIEAKRIFSDLAVSQSWAFAALNLSSATVNRKAAQHKVLSPDESERVIGMAKLIGQIEAMVEESGDAAGFDAAGWMSRWLREPLPALGGRCPVELLDTMEGQALIADVLAQIQSGAYA
jgi:putative toxin-antitoxin system antitoxin component (TIGR02293 family)